MLWPSRMAHIEAVAEMHHRDPPLLVQRRDLLKPVDDVLIGQAVKAVATDARLVELARQRMGVVDPGMGAMEGRLARAPTANRSPRRLPPPPADA
jgi:hypothetical protein